jgi:N-acetyl-gamma-glutamylphosphate reductase
VIDLSDAFRLHAHANGAVYGLPERYRDALRDASFVANPGCYPTATLLALLPLARFASDIAQLIVDAKSGVTGAGRTPVTANLFAEVDGDVRAYGLEGHRHEPEIVQELAAAGIGAPLVFTPHVVPLRRGMLADCYASSSASPMTTRDDRAVYERAYGASRFVRVLPPKPRAERRGRRRNQRRRDPPIAQGPRRARHLGDRQPRQGRRRKRAAKPQSHAGLARGVCSR